MSTSCPSKCTKIINDSVLVKFCRENSDNQSTLSKMSALVNLIHGMNKCGHILCHDLIHHGIESSTNLDMINVESFLDIDMDKILDLNLDLEMEIDNMLF